MNNFYIKTRLFALAGLVFISLLVLAMIVNHSFSDMGYLNETRLLLQKSSTDMQKVRRNEKNFLMTLDIEYQRQLNANIAALIEELQSMEGNIHAMKLDQESSVTELIRYIQQYNKTFNNLVKLRQEIGLTHNSGLRGHLRHAVHEAEADLKKLKKVQLTADMLMLRRNEKDFMLRKLPKYIDKFKKNYAIFMQHLSASDIDTQNKKLIADRMKTYHAGFIALTDGYKRLGLTPESGLQGEMREIAHKTETLFNALSESFSALFVNQEKMIKTQLWLFFAITLGVIVGLLLAVAYSVNARIDQFKTHLTDIALKEGDLSSSLNLDGHDEITELSQLFNQFVGNLKLTFEKIPQFSTRLEEVSVVNVSVSEQTQKLSVEQQTQSEQVVIAMQQMIAAAEDIASNINNAAQSAEQANEASLEGKQAVQQVGSAIHDLAERLKESTNVTRMLEENSNNISTVLEVIRGIAEQTNLLALNAAIEAARAGEQGRGFAVVADEVRTLAQRTQDSTQQIQSLIESLQTNVENTVTIMQESSTSATTTAESTATTIQILDNISHAVHQIFELNSAIASAAEEQTVVSHDVNESIKQINEMAKETVAQSNKTSESSQQINAIAVDLHRLVASYKFS